MSTSGRRRSNRKRRGGKNTPVQEQKRNSKLDRLSDAPLIKTLSPLASRAFSRARESFGGHGHQKPLLSVEEIAELQQENAPMQNLSNSGGEKKSGKRKKPSLKKSGKANTMEGPLRDKTKVSLQRSQSCVSIKNKAALQTSAKAPLRRSRKRKQEEAVTIIEEEVTVEAFSPQKAIMEEYNALMGSHNPWQEESLPRKADDVDVVVDDGDGDDEEVEAEEDSDDSPSKKQRTLQRGHSVVFRSHWAPRVGEPLRTSGNADTQYYRDLVLGINSSEATEREEADFRRSMELRKQQAEQQEAQEPCADDDDDDDDDADDDDNNNNNNKEEAEVEPPMTPRRMKKKKGKRRKKKKKGKARPHSITACESPVAPGSRLLSPAAQMARNTPTATRATRASSEGEMKALQIEQEHRAHRRRLMAELVETEKTYIVNLAHLKEIWASRLKAIMPQDLYKSVFGSLPAIICLSQVHLLPRLQERLQNFEEKPYVGDIFMELLPAFKVYTDYLQNHSSFSRLLNDFRKENKSAYEAVAEEAFAALGSRHMLESYLIQPVQRLPRYQMLLGSMVKVTAANVDEQLPEAHRQLSEITMHINETMNEYENRARLFELAQRFHPSSRDYLLERWMARCPELIRQNILQTPDDELPEAACFLLSDTFVVAEPVKKPCHSLGATQLRAKWLFPLETVFVRDDLDVRQQVQQRLQQEEQQKEQEPIADIFSQQDPCDPCSFYLVNPTQTLRFTAKDAKEAAMWKQATEAAIHLMLEPLEEAEQEAASSSANATDDELTSSSSSGNATDDDDDDDDDADNNEPQYLVVGRQDSKSNMTDERDMFAKHIAALRRRREQIEVSWSGSEWRAIEQEAPAMGCERVTAEDYEKEAEDFTAKALQALYNDPAYIRILEQKKSARTPKKTMLSRIGGAVHKMSPAKWRSPLRMTPSRMTNHRGTTPHRSQLAHQQAMSPISPESRRFTSPRQRHLRITSPIDGTPDARTIALIKKEASPGSRRRLSIL